MSWKVRFVYKEDAEKDSGWGTGFYNNATDLATCQTRANKLAGVLTTLAGDETAIQFIRISNVQKPRQALTYKWTGTAGITAKGDVPAANPSDVPLVALLVSLRTGDLTLKSNITIRGLPDAWTVGGKWTGGGGSGTALNAFSKIMMDGGQGWILRNLDPNRSAQPITGFTGAGVVTTTAPLTLPNPPYVIVNRVKGMPSTSRKFKAINAAGNTFQLFPWPANASAPVLSAASQVTAASYLESTIGFIESDVGTTHKVGRPFKVASGRQKTRKP